MSLPGHGGSIAPLLARVDRVRAAPPRGGWYNLQVIRGPVALALLYPFLLLGCGEGADRPADTGPWDAFRPDAGPPPPPASEPGRHAVEVLSTRRVVPSEGLPAETPPMQSNNNLDVVRHRGRVFLAFRTAPDHFAGPETVIHVVSSLDELSWEHEASYSIGTDLREPRFLSLGESLFLYVSVLGTNRLSFDPMGVSAAEKVADGSFGELTPIGLEGYVAWRTREERGTPYMLAYLGGEHIYNFDGIPLTVELFTTADGRSWSHVDPARPAVYTGGGSEADFAIADDGTLYGVIRNEAGDDTGWGSEICSARAADLTDWRCTVDPRKYDSPLMFWRDGEAYLLARRNVTETGFYDLMTTTGDPTFMTVENQLAYINAPKRCALWRWVQGEDRIAFVLDLPSRGDTCFPARIDGGMADEVVVYNYSSDVDGPDSNWNTGQNGPTFIYRHVLRFTAR